MRVTSAVAITPLVSAAAAWTPASTTGTDILAAEGLVKLAVYQHNNPSPSGCTLENAYVRREWDSLSAEQKEQYVQAVLCLQSKPSISGDLVPGARSRFDDFVGTHINQTLTIHGTGNFLTWHRYFTWTYEQALRNECGYTGYQPYFNWAKYSQDPVNSPPFDGSAASISGNGVYREHEPYGIPSDSDPDFIIPPGVGGGCVTTGPFKNMSVNLGPVAPVVTDAPANPLASGLGYNPRCLRRDISTWCGQTALTDANITALITENTGIYDFETVMQGQFAQKLIGVHTAGHFLVGADPGGDLFASPGDPYFYLHHAQIDRTYWIWQNQNLTERQYAIAGTITLDNDPPSRNTTLEDIIELGVNAPEGITIRDAMSTMAGPFCYIYL